MRTPRKERSRDKEEKKEKKFFPNSEKIYSKYHITPQSNSSSGSDSIGFQISKDDNNIGIKYEKIKSYIDFKNKLNSIDEPCSLDNVDFLKIDKTSKYSQEFPIKIFKEIKQENIIPLNNTQTIHDFFKSEIENKIIFSSKIFQSINQKNSEEKKNFEKIHNYLTAFVEKSRISDFCIFKDLYFPYSYEDIYYGINRHYTANFRAHHYVDDKRWKIDYHFGITGGGKSICSRAIIHNYMHFQLVDGHDVFYPTIFFDIKLINSLLNDKYNLLKIIKYESFGLFREFSDWEKFSNKIAEIVDKYYYAFDIIYSIIKEIFKLKNMTKALIVFDHYSVKFDPNFQYLEKIKKLCSKDTENFILYFYIIFSIFNRRDQEFFFNWFKGPINFPEIERFSDLNNNEASVYHKYELKNIDQVKDLLPDFPGDYENYFDKNISYYYKYEQYNQNNGKLFDDYIDEEKSIIKNDLINYFETINNMSYIKILVKIKDFLINSSNEEISFNNDIYKYFPSCYFIFEKNIKNNKYSVKPAFPLVKTALEELYEDINENNFINIKSEEFRELEGGPKGTIFDIYMNLWFNKKTKSKLFQFNASDIEVIKIPSVIKKNSPNRKIEDFYYEKEVNKEINSSKYLKAIKQKYSNKKINKKCFVIFQAFYAKSIDIYFLIRENDSDSYVLNSIQMKCSDTYIIDENLLKKNTFEMTYVKNKFEILFDINIKSSFITYLSIKEDPKNCALNNESKFFYYNIELDQLVDKNNNEINELPFYQDCFINFIENEIILKDARNFINEHYEGLKFNIKEIENINTNNIIKNNIIILKESKSQISIDIYILGKHSEIKYYSEQKLNEVNQKYYSIEIMK